MSLKGGAYKMLGGAKASYNTVGTGDFITLLLLLVIKILIGAWLVQLCYNKVAPVLIKNAGQDLKNFRPLSFGESLLFYILVHSLLF